MGMEEKTEMPDTLKNWMSTHTTPRIVIALLLITGVILVAAATSILALYPDSPGKSPIYLLGLFGLYIVDYGTHKRRVNALLRDLDHVIHKGETS